MTEEQRRRVIPWVLTAAILAVGITAAVEVGTSGGGGGSSAVSQVGTSPSQVPSPSSPASSAAGTLTVKPSAQPTPARTTSSVPAAATGKLPQLSDTHPSYPPTQTLVDKKDGLVVAVYTVKHGDYLSEIANRFQTPLTDVYVWSEDTVGPNADLIYAGQQIVVKVLEKL
jgi:LysM repeat protein